MWNVDASGFKMPKPQKSLSLEHGGVLDAGGGMFQPIPG
jgi:hypothetical protein